MWIFRNPSNAYLKANFAGWGSIHPGDLLISLSPNGSIKTSSVEEAISRLNSILDLVELNAYYNRFLVLSYVTELYSLQKFSDRFEVWKRSVLELKKGYVFVNLRNLRTILDSQAGVPSTPAYFWVDNSTNSDFIRRGEELPFTMVVSPYGRFIFCRRDPEADPYTPHLSVVS